MSDVVTRRRQREKAQAIDAVGDGHHGLRVVGRSSRPLRPRMKLAGPALTVEVRPGDNLYTASVIAVDADTISGVDLGPGDVAVHEPVDHQLAPRHAAPGLEVQRAAQRRA